jgi:hypothetical protein
MGRGLKKSWWGGRRFYRLSVVRSDSFFYVDGNRARFCERHRWDGETRRLAMYGLLVESRLGLKGLLKKFGFTYSTVNHLVETERREASKNKSLASKSLNCNPKT